MLYCIYLISSSFSYILDGCPTTINQAKLMRTFGIVPVKILDLVLDDKSVLLRAETDRIAAPRPEPLHDRLESKYTDNSY